MARRAKPSKSRAESTGQRVARLRRERGLTQVELAAKLGVKQPVVSLYELDEVRLHGDIIVRLARVLRVTADEILGLEPTKPNGGPKSVGWSRRIQQIDQLPDKDRRALLRTIDGYLAPRVPSGLPHARG